ncbi:MAG: hypothetical protein ABIO04_09575 [Ferruginibacter sp.]
MILIVFIENAFKHARLVRPGRVNIHIETTLENNIFNLLVKNNYNNSEQDSANGIGLSNVERRLTLLYPDGKHFLSISRDEAFYKINLQLQLARME